MGSIGTCKRASRGKSWYQSGIPSDLEMKGKMEVAPIPIVANKTKPKQKYKVKKEKEKEAKEADPKLYQAWEGNGG